MAQNHTEVEKMMEEKGCTGDRITSELIESRIKEVEYQTITLAGQKLMFCGIKMDNGFVVVGKPATFCVIKMDNGFVVVGKPATCIDPANWRDEIGQKISYDNAFSEIWRLEAYRKLSNQL